MLSPAQQIKEKLSIVDVVTSYVRLEKAGVYFKARCPFHNERTASFFVSPARASYHCFGCGRGGDIFSFVEEIEGVSFKEALTLLADRAGVTLTRDIGPKEDYRTLYTILDEAATFYQAQLEKNNQALSYIKTRGLTSNSINSFRLGYAGSGWSLLYTHLHAKGFTDTDIEKTGLISRNKSGWFDRFRDRIMFPISDTQGRIVAFTGRIFTEENAPVVDTAKYVNSPETVLYHKSKILYGYDKAKQSMLKENMCIVVEGQMDLILAHQAGSTNTVAVSGTALSPEHLQLIKRFTDSIAFSFDADTAGFKASDRGIKIALALGMTVSMLKLPHGLDPADCILKDPNLWTSAVANTQAFIPFMLSTLRETYPDQSMFRAKVIQNVLPFVAQVASSIERGTYITLIAHTLGISEKYVEEDLQKVVLPTDTILEENKKTTAPVEIVSSKSRAERQILGFLISHSEDPDSPFNFEATRREFERITGKTIAEWQKFFPPEILADIAFEAEILYSNTDNLTLIAEDLTKTLEQAYLEERFQILLGELKRAEQNKDSVLAVDLVGECQKISKRIHEIKSSRHNIS